MGPNPKTNITAHMTSMGLISRLVTKLTIKGVIKLPN